MIRPKFLLALVLLIVLGLAVGWVVFSWLTGADFLSPVHLGAPAVPSAAESRAGFCCTKPGNRCDAVADPSLCFRGGGTAFNASRNSCDYYCTNVKP